MQEVGVVAVKADNNSNRSNNLSNLGHAGDTLTAKAMAVLKRYVCRNGFTTVLCGCRITCYGHVRSCPLIKVLRYGCIRSM